MRAPSIVHLSGNYIDQAPEEDDSDLDQDPDSDEFDSDMDPEDFDGEEDESMIDEDEVAACVPDLPPRSSGAERCAASSQMT